MTANRLLSGTTKSLNNQHTTRSHLRTTVSHKIMDNSKIKLSLKTWEILILSLRIMEILKFKGLTLTLDKIMQVENDDY